MVLVTSVLAIGEDEHAEAVIAALESLEEPALTLGQVQERRDADALPADYLEVIVTRQGGGGARRRINGAVSRGGHRVTVRVVGAVEGNAHSMRRRSRDALENHRLAVGGHTSTPMSFETADSVGPDDSQWSGLDYWTFTI